MSTIHSITNPGLEGVVVAETSVGDVLGDRGTYHYRGRPATELARTRRPEDVVALLVDGELPAAGDDSVARSLARRRSAPAEVLELVAALVRHPRSTPPLEVLRTAVSALGPRLEWGAMLDLSGEELRDEALAAVAVVPTLVAAAHRLSSGREVVPPRGDLGHAADLLWMLTGEEPDPARTRALEQYLVLTADHGMNTSTFAARVVTSTGSDLASALCAAIGALAGPLHGGAPSRALDMVDEIGDPSRAGVWVTDAVGRGERIMGFGHRVYSTVDPRSEVLRDVARDLGGPTVERALGIEGVVLETLAELKPGHDLCTNVEFYAAVVLDACGIPRSCFTPVFAAARTVGWVAHVLEQASANRLIRPSSRYVGPPLRAEAVVRPVA